MGADKSAKNTPKVWDIIKSTKTKLEIPTRPEEISNTICGLLKGREGPGSVVVLVIFGLGHPKKRSLFKG